MKKVINIGGKISKSFGLLKLDPVENVKTEYIIILPLMWQGLMLPPPGVV